MKTIDLLQIQNEAKKLQNVTYNQALQIVAQQNGFKSYQAILNKIEKDYIDDENEQLKGFKSNVFENRKHIKSNFIKIEKLSRKYEEIKWDSDYNEEKKEELLQEIEEEASKLSNSIAKMFFGNIQYRDSDNEKLFVEGCAYAAYIMSGYKTMINDVNGEEADYFIELNINNQSFNLSCNEFDIYEYDEIDYKGNEIIKRSRAWVGWHEISEIKLP